MRPPVVAVAALARLPSELLRAHGGLNPQPAPSMGARAGDARGIVVDEADARDAFVLRSVSMLVDATDAARAQGVVPGMRVLDAQLVAPTLQFDVITRAALAAGLSAVAEVLLTCSPVVEPLLPERFASLPLAAVALDLTGMVRPVARILIDVQRACARLGHDAAVVASPGTSLSLALARDLARRDPRGRLEVGAAEVDRALQTLPVDALVLSTDLAESLHALGARTASDMARLLPHGALERLGAAASPLLEVLAARFVPLRGITPPEVLAERAELEHPVSELEPLLFVLGPLCARLCVRVRARRARLAEVRLRLARRHGEPSVLTVAFPDPLAEPKAVLRALQVHLERTDLGGPVDSIILEAARLAHRAPRQLALAPDARAQVQAEDALRGLLAELSAELGQGRVGCLALTDDPLPERMTRLAWPAPPLPARPPSPERRRPRRSALSPSPVTEGGRFLSGWPWPLRLLDAPRRLGGELPVVERELLGVLEGRDPRSTRYARVYAVLTLVDGRRALAILDDDEGEVWLQGWFD